MAHIIISYITFDICAFSSMWIKLSHNIKISVNETSYMYSLTLLYLDDVNPDNVDSKKLIRPVRIPHRKAIFPLAKASKHLIYPGT